ncbi:MAG TPA: fluoride efflux transporter CrcB [Ktedonobacter sp.]|nr:fluoride efflux transporter CrcB [Ktedonobacter sp.]
MASQRQQAHTLSVARRITAVFCGGFLGAIARYLLSLLIQGHLGKNWPYDILFINLTGALVLAFVTTLADAALYIGPTRRLFINVGFLGAYTTFSSLVLGDVLLFTKGSILAAILYLILSFVGGFIAVLFGDWLAQRLIRNVKRTHPQAAQKVLREGIPPTMAKEDHLDIEDDFLLPD